MITGCIALDTRLYNVIVELLQNYKNNICTLTEDEESNYHYDKQYVVILNNTITAKLIESQNE